ncbi:zeta toxin family protein [Streptomyces sp. cmx-18-6]|uniref:zeta toxin family protein n=1 Tax=Streptomyces sp. cmx-18-6 TaxID=2790930 RepID=UPI00397FAFDF
MAEPERPPRRLSDEQLADIFREDVQPGLRDLLSQDSPRMVILGGPQGSRKTTLRSVVAEQLELSDALLYDGDDHFAFHPHYDRLARERGALEAARLCGPDVGVLRDAILEEVLARRLNVMFIGPFTDEEYTLGRVATFRDEGYGTELAYTALHPALTEVGVMDRHRWALSEGPGYSFLVPVELQQRITEGVPAIMTVVEERRLADALHLVDAGGIAFSKRLAPDGAWEPAKLVGQAVEETRSRPWAPATREDFLARRAATATPAGESAAEWNKRLARVDALAAPMLNAPATTGQTPSIAQAARGRSTTSPASGTTRKAAQPTRGSGTSPARQAAAPPVQRPATPPAPGRQSSSGRSR